MRWRTMLALLCALLLVAPSCLAFSDTAAALDAADILTLTLNGLKVTQLNGNDRGREALNSFLSPLAARVALDKETARLALLADGAEFASLALASGEWPDPGTMPHRALEAVFSEALPALYEACLPVEEPPEPEERSVSIRNLGRSPRRTTLTVMPEQFAGAETALASLRECVARLSVHLPHAAELNAWMSELNAASALTLKRLEGEDGQALAWQLTGSIASGGKDVRKLTLYGGVKGNDAYVSLKLPARSGKNSLTLTVELKDKAGAKKNTWTGTVTYKRSMNGEACTCKDTLKLENEHDGGERITGTLKREYTAGGIKTVWTLTPSLRDDGGGLTGTLTLKKKHAQTQVWQASLNVSLTAGAEQGESASGGMAEFSAGALAYLTRYRDALPEADRRLLDHMLRTDAWMNGTAVPAPQSYE